MTKHGAWADLAATDTTRAAALYDLPVRVVDAGLVKVVEVDLDQVPRARRRDLLKGATRVTTTPPFAATHGAGPPGAAHTIQDEAATVAASGVMELRSPADMSPARLVGGPSEAGTHR